jgi:hypothetical protein
VEAGTDLGALDAAQLHEALRKADDELLDVQEEREFTLGQTGVHIGANELARLRRAWDRDETRLQEHIDAIKARLVELESTR